MKIYKFLIPNHEWVQDPKNPALSYRGCVAATVAESPDAAHAQLVTYAAQNGFDSRWLRIARVVELPFAEGTVIAWALV